MIPSVSRVKFIFDDSHLQPPECKNSHLNCTLSDPEVHFPEPGVHFKDPEVHICDPRVHLWENIE